MDPNRDTLPSHDLTRRTPEGVEHPKEPEARVLEGIRKGLEDMKAGRSMPLSEFKKRVSVKHGIKI